MSVSKKPDDTLTQMYRKKREESLAGYGCRDFVFDVEETQDDFWKEKQKENKCFLILFIIV